MTPIKAELQLKVEINIDSNKNESEKFIKIISNAFRMRTSPDLKYLRDAESKIVSFIEESKQLALDSQNNDATTFRFTDIFDINVKLDGKPYFGTDPRPEFWGQVTQTTRTEEIIIMQIFADESIAFRTKADNQLRFAQLSKTLKCFLL